MGIAVGSNRQLYAEPTSELSVTAGGERGWGHIGQSLARVEHLVGAGAGVSAQVGLRVRPSVVLGLRGGYGRISAGDALPMNTDVRAYEAGAYVELRFHDTRAAWRPWFGVSTSWRKLAIDYQTGKDTSYHAIDIVRLQVGFERRFAPSTVIGPVLGLSASTFIAQNSPQTRHLERIVDPGASWFLFAGLRARFEVGE